VLNALLFFVRTFQGMHSVRLWTPTISVDLF
jgi:hypothetical protein